MLTNPQKPGYRLQFVSVLLAFLIGIAIVLSATNEKHECSSLEPELSTGEHCPSTFSEINLRVPAIEGWLIHSSCRVDSQAVSELRQVAVFDGVTKLGEHELLITTKCCYGDIRGEISDLFSSVEWGHD